MLRQGILKLRGILAPISPACFVPKSRQKANIALICPGLAMHFFHLLIAAIISSTNSLDEKSVQIASTILGRRLLGA
jgi:hypothetical protein